MARRRVDHLHSNILRGRQRLHDAFPDTGPPPTNKAIVASGARTIERWKNSQGAPDRNTQMPLRTRRSSTRGPARLGREHRTNDAPSLSESSYRMMAASRLEPATFHVRWLAQHRRSCTSCLTRSRTSRNWWWYGRSRKRTHAASGERIPAPISRGDDFSPRQAR